MRRLLWLFVVACGNPSTTPADDADTDTVGDTDDTVEDTEIVWDTGDGNEPGNGEDTGFNPFVVDPNIGATALDGVWKGTLVYLDVWPDLLVKEDPRCEGTVELVIDGTADRHVIAEFRCTVWDPNFKLGGLPAALAGPYGDLEGIAFASLDPNNLTEFRLDTSIVATNMNPFTRRVKVTSDGTTLTVNFNGVSVGSGQRVTFEATRQPAP